MMKTTKRFQVGRRVGLVVLLLGSLPLLIGAGFSLLYPELYLPWYWDAGPWFGLAVLAFGGMAITGAVILFRTRRN
jgi:hypothetical protein